MVYETVAVVLTRSRSPRRVVQMEMGGWLMLGLAFVCMFHSLPLDGWPGIFFLLNYLLVLENILNYFRIAGKLGKVGEDWMGIAGEGRSGIPPENPAAS